jgi:hypothetical protein
MRVGDRVVDSWWPKRVGTVIRLGRRRTVVKWDNGEVWYYDGDRLFLYSELEAAQWEEKDDLHLSA